MPFLQACFHLCVEVSFLNPLTCREKGDGGAAVWILWGKGRPMAKAGAASVTVSLYALGEFPRPKTFGESNESLKKHFPQCLGHRELYINNR